MKTKGFLASRFNWLGILVMVSAVIPLIVDLVKAVQPDAVVLTSAIATFALGLVTVVIRTFFTDTPQIKGLL